MVVDARFAVGAGLLLGAAVAVGLDRLHDRLGYHANFSAARGRTRARIAGFGLTCGAATAVGAWQGVWVPLLLLLCALAVAVRREVSPPPEFVPIADLEPSVGPDVDATVVEDGLVLSDLLGEWAVWAALAALAGAVEIAIRAAMGWPVPGAFAATVRATSPAAVAVALGALYPLALAGRRPWRRTSFGEGSRLTSAALWAYTWGGAWATLSVAAVAAVGFGLVAPLAALVAVLALVHLPPDEGDAPVELLLAAWPLALLAVLVIAAVERFLRAGGAL